jgi:hypothetical protein
MMPLISYVTTRTALKLQITTNVAEKMVIAAHSIAPTNMFHIGIVISINVRCSHALMQIETDAVILWVRATSSSLRPDTY